MDGFDLADYSPVTNGSGTTPSLIEPGVYQFELTPTNAAAPVSMSLTINGTAISTVFGESFASSPVTVPYDVQMPTVTSPTQSRWAKGVQGSFRIEASYASSISTGALPAGLEFNATTLTISGTPVVSGSSSATITATNPMGNDPQNHQFTIYDPTSFAAKMEIDLIGATAGESPDNLPGLIVQLDANSLTEANGSALYSWPDSSGGGHALDQARGIPSVTTSQALGGKKVVSFDGFSQLYSTYDFGSSLTEYTVLALARHTGESNQTIIGSVGSDWVFGWGNGSSSYWKMGNTIAQSVPADQSWHLLAGTFDSEGNMILWRDGVKVAAAHLRHVRGLRQRRRHGERDAAAPDAAGERAAAVRPFFPCQRC